MAKSYGFEKKHWKQIQENVFKNLWAEGGLVYYVNDRTILAYIPQYYDPAKGREYPDLARKSRVRQLLEASWKENTAGLNAELLITESHAKEDRPAIKEVIDNPYRGIDLLMYLYLLIIIGIISGAAWLLDFLISS